MKQFAQRLRALREEAGLRQEELAEAIDVTRATIASYELGRTAPDSKILPRICRALGCTPDYLLGFSPFQNHQEFERWMDMKNAVSANLRHMPQQRQEQLMEALNWLLAQRNWSLEQQEVVRPLLALAQNYVKLFEAFVQMQEGALTAQGLAQMEQARGGLLDMAAQVCSMLYEKLEL